LGWAETLDRQKKKKDGYRKLTSGGEVWEPVYGMGWTDREKRKPRGFGNLQRKLTYRSKNKRIRAKRVKNVTLP